MYIYSASYNIYKHIIYNVMYVNIYSLAMLQSFYSMDGEYIKLLITIVGTYPYMGNLVVIVSLPVYVYIQKQKQIQST